jgi:S-adenosylmethionine decarboxylase
MPESLGVHVLLDLHGVEERRLADAAWLRDALVAAARRGGACVVETTFHRFDPQGVSGVVVLAESHLAVHTWPELGFAAVDVFTCGAEVVADAVAAAVVDALGAREVTTTRCTRGPRRDPRREEAEAAMAARRMAG